MKLKKIMAGVLSVATVLSFAGCNSNDTPSNSSSSSSTSSTSSSTDGSNSTTDSSTTDNSTSSTPANNPIDNETQSVRDNFYDASKITDGLTLKVLTHRTDLCNDSQQLQEWTKEFEEQFNCKVEYHGFTKYAGDVTTMMSTDNYGDVLMIPDQVKVMDLGNFFEPLGDYETLNERYFWMDQKMYDNVVYGIPHMGAVSGGLCYNKRIWSEAGVTEIPKTPEDFVAALKKIKDQFDGEVIPYYTNFNTGWALAQIIDMSVAVSGNSNIQNDILTSKRDLFVEGEDYYNTMKLMFDIFKETDIHEEDPMTGDWEGSKPAINAGKIATMIMGSWAVSQFQESGDNPQDIGYMPAPFTKDGKQYAQSTSDYALGVNVHSDEAVKELGKAYIDWFVNDSPYISYNQGVSPVRGADMPDYLEAFADCEFFVASPAPDGLVGVWNAIDNDSEIGLYNDDAANFKIRMAEAAFKNDEAAFKAIIDECNKKWAETRDANEDYLAYMATLG